MGRAILPPLKIAGVEVWPPVTLAPMAGATDSVLRVLCKRQSAGLVCTELTSSHGLYHQNPKSYRFLEWTDEEHPISAQIFGAEPDIMAEAARVVAAAAAFQKSSLLLSPWILPGVFLLGPTPFRLRRVRRP